jgi:hypothetical protein
VKQPSLPKLTYLLNLALLLTWLILLAWLSWIQPQGTDDLLIGRTALAVAALLSFLNILVIRNRRGRRVRQADSTNQRTPEIIFEVLSHVLPTRINVEMLGDALERIHRERNGQDRRWLILTILGCTVFWTAVNAVREITTALFGHNRRGS